MSRHPIETAPCPAIACQQKAHEQRGKDGGKGEKKVTDGETEETKRARRRPRGKERWRGEQIEKEERKEGETEIS